MVWLCNVVNAQQMLAENLPSDKWQKQKLREIPYDFNFCCQLARRRHVRHTEWHRKGTISRAPLPPRQAAK